MFGVLVEFDIKDGQISAFKEAVCKQAEDSLTSEPDCHVFDVAHDKDAPNTIILYELYTDAAAFDAHLKSAHFKAFDANVSDLVAAKRVRAFTLIQGTPTL